MGFIVAPLIEILLPILRAVMFWKGAAFIAVLLTAFTDAGKKVFFWFMSFVIDLMFSLVSNFIPDFPVSAGTLVSQLPLEVLQGLGAIGVPECFAMIASALGCRLVLRVIPLIGK